MELSRWGFFFGSVEEACPKLDSDYLVSWQQLGELGDVFLRRTHHCPSEPARQGTGVGEAPAPRPLVNKKCANHDS